MVLKKCFRWIWFCINFFPSVNDNLRIFTWILYMISSRCLYGNNTENVQQRNKFLEKFMLIQKFIMFNVAKLVENSRNKNTFLLRIQNKFYRSRVNFEEKRVQRSKIIRGEIKIEFPLIFLIIMLEKVI